MVCFTQVLLFARLVSPIKQTLSTFLFVYCELNFAGDAMSRRINATYVKTIYQRQKEPAWDHSYQPSIQATAKEAPSVSKASLLYYRKFNRKIHLLSGTELKLCIFGIYNPNVIGLQEQRILSPISAVHPLWTHPEADRLLLKPLRGVIEVSKELGYESFLKKISIKNKSGESLNVPVPLVGDLLFAIQKDEKFYCVNWSIKSVATDFSSRKLYQYNKFNRGDVNEKILARSEIERAYYQSACIPTHFVSEDNFSNHLLNNLRHLFLYHYHFQQDISSADRTELLHHFQTAFHQGIPPVEVIRKYYLKEKFSPEISKFVLYNSIWNRKILVDLYQPLLIDRPLNPEKINPLEQYKYLFEVGQ